ncbi:MAG: hypothetical protein REI12_09015 [Pedobacter sp.]|nr:hypothetical protein [Pedobacter sp.]
MNQPFRFRRAPQLLALAVAALSLTQAADAADLRKRLNVRQEASEVVLGTTMYDYYQGDSFSALNDILLAKAMGRIDESVTTSELLLGDLYTAFGMPDEADTTFSRMAARDMRTQTRNETLFRKGRLQYQQGNYFEAERILNVPLDTQITPLEAERRVMLANVMMSRNEFVEARNLLAPIPLDSQLGAYATYNTGVAHLRADRSPEGVALLQQVMNLPVSDSETNALKDRAALAIGYNFLQQQDPEKARDALINVRLEGPFSNAALLALGYANYEKKDYKRSLSFWLELLTRNPGDPSVQEAMILAPRAYEGLNASQQAFFGYKLAITTLSNQLAELDKLGTAIKKPEWLDGLSPSSDGGVNADPMDVAASVTPADPDTVALLYGLFAQHPFNEGFQQYVQLQRLKLLLDQRAYDLRALRDTAAVMQKRQSSLPGIATRVDAVQKRLGLVADRWPILEKRGRQVARDGKSVSGGAVSVQNMERQFKLGQAEEYLAKQPDTAANRLLKNRVRTLKGLVLMDIASRAPASQEQIYADIASNETQLRLTQVRMEALQQLLADNQKVAGTNNAERIRTLETRLASSQKQVDKALDEYRLYLRTLAENQLDDTRTRINNDLAEAHLSIARLQDAALNRGGADGASGKPQP